MPKLLGKQGIFLSWESDPEIVFSHPSFKTAQKWKGHCPCSQLHA